MPRPMLSQDKWTRILRLLASAAGLETTDMPGGLRRRQTDKAVYLINYDEENAEHEGHEIQAFGVKRVQTPA